MTYFFLGISAIFLILACSIKYEFKENHLRIYYVFFVYIKIPYDKIVGVYPIYSVLAAPALSFERVRIEKQGRALSIIENRDFIDISPKNRDDFIAELKARTRVEIFSLIKGLCPPLQKKQKT